MIRNPSEYQAIIMGKTQEQPLFKCENSIIPVTSEIELLGVSVDNKLKFDSHTRKICRKVSQQIAALTERMKKLLPFETRKDLRRAFILPHFNYYAETWHHCSKRCAAKLEENVNERAIRFVCNSDKSTPYEALLKQEGLSTTQSKTHQDSHHSF